MNRVKKKVLLENLSICSKHYGEYEAFTGQSTLIRSTMGKKRDIVG